MSTMQGGGDTGADPPANAEIDIEETVELDEGLDLENWDGRDKERDQNGLTGVLGGFSARFKSPSAAMIVGIAYHVAAFLFIVVYAVQTNSTPLQRCPDAIRILNYPLIAAGLTWVISCGWMVFRLFFSRERNEPKEIELALIEAEELPDSDRPEVHSPTSPSSSISSRLATIGWHILTSLPYVASVIALLILMAGIGGLMYVSAQMTAPVLAGSTTVSGLSGPARIEREANGLVHIYAATERDAFFAQGIAMAQERLWQMEIQRRAGAGLLSEVLGTATLDVDLEMRTLGLYRASERAAAYMRLAHPSVVDGMQAFADGVNHYIAQGHPLPFEFTLADFKPGHFGVEDVLTMGKLMALDLGSNAGQELDRYEMTVSQERMHQLWPPYPHWAPTIITHADANQTLDEINQRRDVKSEEERPQDEQQEKAGRERMVREKERSAWRRYRMREGIASWTDASNNWVISGKHTVSGKPILANDPHLGFSAPSIWILMHLHTDDGLNVIGAALPGVPGIVLGRNDYITWGITNVAADVQDLYVIAPAPDPRYYVWQGGLVAYDLRTESIPVKGASAHELIVRNTVFGPVVNDVMDIKGPAMAFKWVGLSDADTTPAAFYAVNRATTYQEWRDALRLFVAPSSNFIFADTSGNIAYQCTGLIPIRAFGDGSLPVGSNATEGALWTGYIPFDELPHVLNPQEGFIVTANNKVIGDEYPHLILNNMDWEEGYRATRLRDLIEGTISRDEKITVRHVQTWQSDQTTVMWSQNLRPILASLDALALSTKAEQFRQAMLGWDGNINASSIYALPYEDWFFRLASVTLKELGAVMWGRPYFIQDVFTKGDVSCGQLDQCLAFAATAFEATVQSYSGSTTIFGEKHVTLFAHAVLGDGRTPVGCLWDRTVKVGGDSYTINPSSIRPSATGAYVSRHGASYREVVDLSAMEESKFIHPMGQSGSPFSAHYDDYLPVWASGAYIPMRTAAFTVAETYTITPKEPMADTTGTTTSSTNAATLASTFTTANAATVTGRATTSVASATSTASTVAARAISLSTSTSAAVTKGMTTTVTSITTATESPAR